MQYISIYRKIQGDCKSFFGISKKKIGMRGKKGVLGKICEMGVRSNFITQPITQLITLLLIALYNMRLFL